MSKCTLRLSLSVAFFWAAFSVSTTSSRGETIRVPQEHERIQLAIDSASAGDIVLVSPGVYRERVVLKKDVTLRSAGDNSKGKLGLKRAESTIIDGGGENGTGAGVAMREGAVLDGFTITNVGVYDEAKWNKHHATQGEEQSYEHIGAPGIAGVAIEGVTCVVRNNIVHRVGYTGIAISGKKRTEDADGTCSPHVEHNICFRNMGGGIGSMRKSTAIIVENTCFENFYAGIGHDDASPTVIGNTCFENIRAGIGISEGSSPVVRGNKCYRNRRAGIGTRTGAETRPIIEDNECYENEMAGIGTREEARPLIRGNRCYKNKLAGIGSRTHAAPTIIGNECFENGEAGIGQQSDAVTILIENYCHDNKTSGIGFARCDSGRATVLNNRVIDNKLVAVGINHGWSVVLSGNELSREDGMPPIAMVFAGAEATFTDNVIRGGGVAAIRVGGKVRAEGNRFVGLALRKVGPPNFGIWALPGAELKCSGNRFSGWRHAIHATEATVTATKNEVSDFHGYAIVVKQPSSSADLYSNTAYSKTDGNRVVLLEGDAGVVRDNQIKPEVQDKADRSE